MGLVGEALIVKYVVKYVPRVPLVHAVVLTRDSGAGPFAPPVTLKLPIVGGERLLGINAIIR